MINNCSHQKIGYFLQNSDVLEICDICNDIECIESHKLILKDELREFSQCAISLLNDCYTCLYEQLPEAIDNLKQSLQTIYQGLIENTTKSEYQDMIDILENKENKHLTQLVEFYSKRSNIRMLKDKLDEGTSFVNQVQKFNQQFIITDTQSQISKTKNQFTKFRINHLKKEESLIQSNSAVTYNLNRIETLNSFEIPTKFKFKHLYSVTWLSDKLIGVAAGEFHPYIIYDPEKKYIHQQIVEEKNGVYDSMIINKDSLVLAYVRNIKVFQLEENKYICNNLEFEKCEGTPSRLYYCKASNSIFSSDSYFNYLYPINYINRWSLSTGKLIRYKINGKTYGHLCFLQETQIFYVSLFVEDEKKRKSQRKNYIYLWHQEKQDFDKKINTKDTIHAMTILDNSLIGFCQEISIWNAKSLTKILTIQYPEEKFNPQSVNFTNFSIIFGCENGSIIISYALAIWVCNKQFQEWEKLFKMNAKTMKISEHQDKVAISAYNCSFCVLQLKN